MMEKGELPSRELITVEEAARRVNVTPEHFYRLIGAGKLDGCVRRFFGRTNVDWAELMARMNAGYFQSKKRGHARGKYRAASHKKRSSEVVPFDFSDKISGAGASREPVFDVCPLEGGLNQ